MSVDTWINCAVTRTRSPACVTVPFHHGVDVQLPPDLLDALLRPEVPHHRGARRDAEGPDLREIGDQGIGQAVGKVLLFGIAGEVLQRDDRERRDLWSRTARFATHFRAPAMPAPIAIPAASTTDSGSQRRARGARRWRGSGGSTSSPEQVTGAMKR